MEAAKEVSSSLLPVKSGKQFLAAINKVAEVWRMLWPVYNSACGTVMRHGDWKSDAFAQRYTEESIKYKERIGNKTCYRFTFSGMTPSLYQLNYVQQKIRSKKTNSFYKQLFYQSVSVSERCLYKQLFLAVRLLVKSKFICREVFFCPNCMLVYNVLCLKLGNMRVILKAPDSSGTCNSSTCTTVPMSSLHPHPKNKNTSSFMLRR